MTNYFPAIAIPTNVTYQIHLLDIFRSSSAKIKKFKQEENQKNIIIDTQKFIAVEIQTTLDDVKNTTFNKFLVDVVRYIQEYAPNVLVEQALPYLRAFNEKTISYEALDIPPFTVSLPDDGELLIEWNFEHFKVGLSFETNPDESSWYIVNDGTVRKMTGWAYLNSQSETELVNTILSQVVENVA